MSFFKTLFATPEMVRDGFNAVTKGIDAAIFTTEESVHMWIKYLESTQPQNAARRWIALIVTGTWAYFCLVATVAIFLASREIVADVIQFGTLYIMPPSTVIVSWYFWKGVKDKS